MKTSTLIVAVALTASVLLLALPKKGAVTGSEGDDSTPFVPKVRAMESTAPSPYAGQLTAQLLRIPSLEWQRDPFEPIKVAPDPSFEEPPVEELPMEEPVEEPAEEPAEEPPALPQPQAKAPRTGPLPVLSGISESGAHRLAIVDRLIVEEGDALPSGDVVMSIGIRTVTLRSNEEIVVIRLGNGR